MDGNVYYDPKSWGLEVVDSVDFADSYEFDMIVVWHEVSTDKFFYASDSGCSCPTPFEGYKSMAELNPLNEQTLDEFVSFVKGNSRYSDAIGRAFLDKIVELIQTV